LAEAMLICAMWKPDPSIRRNYRKSVLHSAMPVSEHHSQVRLAELVAALSLGIDLGFGQPMEHVLRQCLIGLRLAEHLDLDEQARRILNRVPQPLPRFLQREQREADLQKLARIILEAGDAADAHRGKPLSRSADGHDPQRLRGLPAIGRNVSGRVNGSDPVAVLLAKESGRRRT
jgi:hypothetical protein